MTMKETTKTMPRRFEKIYPSAIFDTDEKYKVFLDNLLKQTEMLSLRRDAAFFIPAKDMMKKKILHDFLMETKRRFIKSLLKPSKKLEIKRNKKKEE